MGTVDTTTLAYQVGRLDRAALREFVADVWASRGYETTIDEALVRARTETETVRIAVGTRPDDEEITIDVLVAPSGGSVDQDLRVLDAADLAQMLRYAVGPGAARSICERHFGAPPAALSPAPTTRIRRGAAALGKRTPPVVVVIAALVLVALAGLAQLPGPSDPETANSGANGTAAPPATTPSTPVQITSMPVPAVGPDWKSPPPGGYEQFICGAPDAPNATALPAADCVDPVNGSARTAG